MAITKSKVIEKHVFKDRELIKKKFTAVTNVKKYF
jgi:hypothetical protein